MLGKIAVIGLGYVGLPVAVAFAEKFPGTIGFDIDSRRVGALRGGKDWTDEVGNTPVSYTHLTLPTILRV